MNRDELLKALKDLKELHDQGILTAEEFAREKEVYLHQLRDLNISVSQSGSISIPPEIQALSEPPPSVTPEPSSAETPHIDLKGSDFFATGGFSPLSWDSAPPPEPPAVSSGPPPEPPPVSSGPPPEPPAVPESSSLSFVPVAPPPAAKNSNPFSNTAPPSSAFSVPPSAVPPAPPSGIPVAPVAPVAPMAPPVMPAPPPPAATLTLRSLPKAPPRKPPTGAGQDSNAGTVLLGRYRLKRKLGESALNQVYLVDDTWTEEECVVKILRSEMSKRDKVRTHLAKELERNHSLQHPGLTNSTLLYEDEVTGLWFYATEYVQGDTLLDLMEDAKERGRLPLMPLERCAELIRDVSVVLGYLGKQNVVHRGVRPSNIFLLSNGQVMLSDAGVLSALYNEPAAHFTGLMGMIGHTAPELLRGREATPATDVYSLGVVLYQLLTGSIPIGRPVPPSEQVKRVPEAIDKVVAQALAEEPADRYRSAPLFARAVKRALL